MPTGWTSLRPSKSFSRAIGGVAVLAAIVGQAALATAARYSAADGLPSAAVTAIAPDDAGRLWVGTDAGLRVLVGGQFVVETSMVAERSTSPVHRETIRDIAVSESGEVWVATAGTLHHRIPEGAWGEAAEPEVGLEGGVAAVLVTRDGDVWAGGENAGLVRRTGGAWAAVDRGFQVTALAVDGSGAIWVAGGRDGQVLVKGPGTPDELAMPLGTGGLPAGTAQALAAGRDGAWLGTSAGLAFVSTEGTVTTWGPESDLPSLSILSIAPVGTGAWVGTASGLAFVDGGTVDVSAGIAAGLTGVAIESLARDRAGDLWVGTMTDLVKLPLRSWVQDGEPVDGFVSDVGYTSAGVEYAVSDGALLLRLDTGWTGVSGLQDSQLLSVAPDRDGGVLVGTEAGWGRVRDGDFIPDERCCAVPVGAIFEDAVGRVWVGTEHGLFVVDVDGGTVPFRKSNDASGLGQDPVIALFAGDEATVWVVTANGGATPFDGLDPGIRVSRNTMAGGPSSDLVRAGLVSSNGDVWLGTEDGLNRGTARDWEPLGGVLAGDIRSIVEDAATGRVWVGTESGGLVLVNCSIRFDGGCATSVFDEADGLGAPHVTSLAFRGEELLIGTARGLTRHVVDRTAPTLTLGTVASVASSADGIRELHPNRLVVDDEPCDLCSSGLPFDTRTVAIGLVGTDLEDPQGVRFLVASEVAGAQLVTTPSFWRSVEPDQTYRTTVTAFDRHFNVSDPAVATFDVEPTPLYREPWFYLLVGLVIALMVLALWVWWQNRDRLGYRDAVLAFRSAGDQVEARLTIGGSEPEWQPVGSGVLRLTELHDGLRSDRRLDSEVVATLGNELYRTVAGRPEEKTQLARGRPIWLGLDLGDVAALDPLPWEVIQGPSQTIPSRADGTDEGGPGGGERLAEGELALFRRVGAPDDTPPAAPNQAGRGPRLRLRAPRFRVLVAWAKPRDRAFVSPGEYQAIEEIAKRSEGRLELVPMSLVQRDRLTSELAQDLDIFHFIGHGEMRETGPVLLFEGQDGRGQAANLQQLTEALRLPEGRTRRPRLVILSACQSAEEAADQPATGLAAGLVAAGVVPAAIGMGYLFHMQSARAFTDALYGEILRTGQIEAAVAIARRTIRQAAVDKDDWLVPRLYARELGRATFELRGGGR